MTQQRLTDKKAYQPSSKAPKIMNSIPTNPLSASTGGALDGSQQKEYHPSMTTTSRLKPEYGSSAWHELSYFSSEIGHLLLHLPRIIDGGSSSQTEEKLSIGKQGNHNRCQVCTRRQVDTSITKDYDQKLFNNEPVREDQNEMGTFKPCNHRSCYNCAVSCQKCPLCGSDLEQWKMDVDVEKNS